MRSVFLFFESVSRTKCLFGMWWMSLAVVFSTRMTPQSGWSLSSTILQRWLALWCGLLNTWTLKVCNLDSIYWAYCLRNSYGPKQWPTTKIGAQFYILKYIKFIKTMIHWIKNVRNSGSQFLPDFFFIFGMCINMVEVSSPYLFGRPRDNIQWIIAVFAIWGKNFWLNVVFTPQFPVAFWFFSIFSLCFHFSRWIDKRLCRTC